ncbi:MAG TPA: glycosyltransferase family 4 protein [Vicinamibacterales bacterium]|jgi:phosphatidylinositol alpha-mannosyltransferase|nr:glycosyltransferase family 4 protein [Vicinamibacterales bacterium]
MQVAIVAPYDLSRPGGVNTQIRAQARALEQLGHRVVVAGPASSPLPDGEVSLGRAFPVTFGGTESGLGVDPRAAVRLRRLLAGCDLVHVHEPFTPLAPWLAIAAAAAPVVGTFHVHRERGHRWYRSMGWALRPLSRRLSARIAVSEAAKRTVAAHFPGTYEIVPNGIDVTRFRRPAPRPAAFETGRLHVLYIGRLEPRKGVDVLVRAMAAVQRQLPGALLTIGGDGSERGRLEALARDAGADVRFAGAVAEGDLPAWFRAADVLCSPALGGESFGIVLLEAMAAGRPVVASRIDGYEGLVAGRDCARLVPPGDPSALGAALVELLADAGLRARMGAAGEAVAAAYDWPAVAGRLVEIYETARQAQRPPSARHL